MVTLRLYEPRDRAAVRRICADTGLLGDPIDPVFEDRELWCDLMIAPYLAIQPQHCWVAESGGQVVGYLTGAASRWFGQVSIPWQAYTTLRMIANRVRGRYRERSRRFVDWLVLRSLREKVGSPRRFYAHFHFNLDAGHRGLGCGPQLLQRFEDQLRQKGIRELYAESLFREGDPDPALWARLGFREHGRARTRMFVPPVQKPLYWVSYLKTLA